MLICSIEQDLIFFYLFARLCSSENQDIFLLVGCWQNLLFRMLCSWFCDVLHIVSGQGRGKKFTLHLHTHQWKRKIGFPLSLSIIGVNSFTINVKFTCHCCISFNVANMQNISKLDCYIYWYSYKLAFTSIACSRET